jgi:hypothetical protein
VFGDRVQALREADSLMLKAEAASVSWEAVATVLNVSLARLIVDDREPDLTPLISAYEHCIKSQMLMLALHCASRLAAVYLDMGALLEARHWGQVSADLDKRVDSPRRQMDYLSSQTDLALLAGDGETASRLIDLMPHSSPKLLSGLSENSLFLYRLRHEQLAQRSVCSGSDLNRLLNWHERAKSFGRHDDHMEVLWVALVDHGSRAEASSLLEEYLQTSRRERRAPGYFLRTRTADDPAWLPKCPHAGQLYAYERS